VSSFGGFDLGNVRELRIRSYTVGAGQSAQLTALVIEVWRENSPEPELVEVDYGDEGPPLAAVQVMVRAVNRQQRVRRGEEP
jgi:FMN-dependent NADH-azoreductase